LGYIENLLWTSTQILIITMQDYKTGTVCVRVQMGGGEWLKEIKMRVYGWWTSYTYMKKNFMYVGGIREGFINDVWLKI
jgi:hypothetical protein